MTRIEKRRRYWKRVHARRAIWNGICMGFNVVVVMVFMPIYLMIGFTAVSPYVWPEYEEIFVENLVSLLTFLGAGHV